MHLKLMRNPVINEQHKEKNCTQTKHKNIELKC